MVARLLVVALLATATRAAAQPTEPTPPADLTLHADPYQRPPSTEPMWFPQPPRRLRRSFAIATAEVLAINGIFWLVAFSIGKPYSHISLDSIEANLTSDWVWDEDAFATNQFGHPYLGSLMYNAARSNGFGMLGASIFTFAGSGFWELFMETETPSINDQFFTPFGGVLFGEVLHRFGRALLWNGDPRPRVARVILSTIVDPVGMFSSSAFGDAWAQPQPPAMFGFVSAGWNGVTSRYDTGEGTVTSSSLARLHVAIGISYGMPIDASFRPTRPMDHFEFLAEGDVSPDGAFLSVHTRGLLWGRAFSLGPAHAVGGLFGGYDFENPENIRVGAASLGIGASFHLPLGDRNFLQGTGVISAIPFGAAGGNVKEQPGMETERDYHRGWGSSQLFIARLGRRGLGMAYASSSIFEIDGTYFDEGTELVSFTRVGGMMSIIGHHGINVEGVFSTRRGTFEDNSRDRYDSSAQLRISYTLMQDLTFGGGAANR